MKDKKFRVVIIPSVASLMEMKRKTKKIKGANLTTVMYKIGESAGNDFFEYFIKNVKGRKNKLKKIFETLNLTNYGEYELKRISKNSIIIKLTQSPIQKICSQSKEHSCHLVCHWMSGLFSGLFKNLNEKWLFERSKCKNLGHPHCEFKGVIK